MNTTNGGATPRAWLTEVADELVERLGAAPWVPVVALTYRLGLPDRLAEAGMSVNDVLADLKAGFLSERRTGASDEYFVLRSSRFKVFVHTEFEREAQRQGIELPLAVISKVEPQRGMPYRASLVRATVTLDPPYAQAECDIAVVHRQVQAQKQYQLAVQRARDRSVRLLSQGARTDTSHADLHAQVRRHFSALQQMIELLQQRSETAGARRARGIVLDPSAAYPDTFCVSASQKDDDFNGELTVQIAVAGHRKRWNLELVAVDDDLFYLSLPQDTKAQNLLTPGTAVELAYKPRFGLGRHSYALSRLLREEVEGDWEVLARLVSDPGSLSAPDAFPPPARFFDTRLNPEQRAAVAGALGTPHAFFIQGPPGTGKTTVIGEIVRQLTARGERVLLLAPMHVAVDEVLQRVGDADGVLALRASYDDSKVREDLRRFTKDKLTAEFVRKARRPESSRAAQWSAEASRLQAERESIEAILAAGRALTLAQVARDRAIGLRETWRAGHRAALDAAIGQQASTQRAMAAAQLRFGEAELATAAAAQALAEAESAGVSLFRRVQAAFGVGDLARLRSVLGQADRDVLLARATRDQAAARNTERIAAVQHFQHQGRRQDQEHAGACARAVEEAESATQRLSVARGQLDSAGLARASEAELAERARQDHDGEDRLGRLVYLEKRWFQLTGLASGGSAAAQAQIAQDLGDRLIGAANLICCTTTGFGGDDDLRDADYDTMIVDEASRVIDSEFLIGAKQGRRWVLVGDEHQLPPFVAPDDEHHLHALAALHMVERGAANNLNAAVKQLSQLWEEDEELHQFRDTTVQETAERLRDRSQWSKIYRPAYAKAYERLRQDNDEAERELLRKMRHHLVQSIFERCVAEGPLSLRSSLIEQRRMIDPIAALVRQPIYGGRYLSPDPEQQTVTPLVTSRTFPQPVVFLDTSGHPRAAETPIRPGFFNKLEAEWVETACRAWDRELAARGEKEITVSVLTFYKAQARLIRQRLGAPRFRGFHVLRFKNIDTIDRLQGQESDLVLISFCRTKPGRERELHRFGMWLQDVRRLNVACTRAQRALVLIGHKNTLSGMRGIDAAERFYSHMFSLFAPPSAPGTVLLKQLDRPGR
jgi:hypothetical protein